MTHVVTGRCVDCRYTDCCTVCPVECFYETKDPAMLVIDPAADDRLVVFPDPGYPAYQRGALFCGGEAHPVLLDGDHIFRPWQLSDDVLARTRLMWLNSPHNPSGAITSLADLHRIAELCRRWDILVVADETYADLYSDEVPHSLLEAGVEVY